MRLAVTAIPEFRDGAKLAFLSFQSKEGEKFQAGVPAEFAKTLSVGDKAEAEVETIPGKDGKQDWRKLKSWDGKPTEPDRPQFKGGGGGGRPAYTPKSREEIHSSCIAGIIKSGLDQGMEPEAVGKYLDLYHKHAATYAEAK